MPTVLATLPIEATIRPTRSTKGAAAFSCEVDHTDDDKTSISPIIISRRWPEIGVTNKLNHVRRLRRLMIEETKDHQYLVCFRK
jgi:hypothetical protein